MPRKSFDASVLGEFFWNSTDLLSILGSDGTWKIVNGGVARAQGWSLEDLQSSPFIDLVHPDDVAATVREFDRMVAATGRHLDRVPQPPTSPRRNVPMDRVELSGPQRHGLFRRARRHEPSRRTDGVGGQSRDTRAILDAVVDSIITIDEQFGCSTSVPVPTESTAFRTTSDEVRTRSTLSCR